MDLDNNVLSMSNPLLRTFMFYGAILLLKMIAMSFWTAFHRIKNKSFANTEDARGADPTGKKGLVPRMNDEDVERVRRAHLNDMENIYLFLILGFFYVCTGPCVVRTTLLFRVFTGARVLHSLVYVNAVRQPARGLCYLVGQIVNIYMAVIVIRSLM